jgi:GDP-L-fucose synthase
LFFLFVSLQSINERASEMKRILFLFLFFFPSLILGNTFSKDSKIYLAGHGGLVGKAILKELSEQGYHNIIYKNSKELDLRSQEAVRAFFQKEKPDLVILAAAKVGGIKANSEYPADFIYDNLAIELNIIHEAYLNKVEKLLFLGSSCIYPKMAPQPMTEEVLMTSALEETNEPYAIAKIAGLKLCEAYNRQYGTRFISCMPTNLYGPGDNFDLESSHVMPALIAKIVNGKRDAKAEVEVWGTGRVKREFLHVNDLAKAALFLIENYEDNLAINVGMGSDISIADLAYMIKKIVGYEGRLVFNPKYPDGTPRKLLDTTKINQMGWEANIALEEGIKSTVIWYEENYENSI